MTISQAAHNLDVPDLLQLPEPILNRIFVHSLQLPPFLEISYDGVEVPCPARSELSLFRVSKKTRKLALPIFYKINSFKILVENFDMTMVNNWLERVRPLRLQTVDVALVVPNDSSSAGESVILQEPAQVATDTLDSDSIISITLTGYWSWADLLECLHLYHQGQLPSYISYLKVGSAHRVMLAFKIVRVLAREDWSVVEQFLPSIRGLLSLTNRDWMDNI